MLAIPVHGGVMRVLALPGAGPPLVFLHGLGCASSHDYPMVAAAPPLAGRHALLIDLLGFGFAEADPGFAGTVDAHAATVIEVLDTLDQPTCDLYGHSMGGSIAITVAATWPSRVRRLIASEPNLDPGGGAFSRGIAAEAEASYVSAGHARVCADAAATGNLAWAGSMRVAAPRAVHRGATSLVQGTTPTWRAALYGAPMPRTVLFGARSLPDPDLAELPRHGVAVRVIDDVGHSMAVERPAALAAALADALADGPAA